MGRSRRNKSGGGLILLFFLIIIVIAGVVLFINKDNIFEKKSGVDGEQGTVVEPEPEPVKIVDIIDVNSKSRPFAVVVNNTPVAVKVQEGLNKAYLIYEIPTEGNTSRMLAFFKDVEDVTVGTNRSIRHNFIDYALESNAILAGFGWSHYAQDDLQKGKAIDYIQGLFDKPFWRNNPEKLASEHTAYTSIAKLRDYAQNTKKYSLESETAEKTILLNYNVEDVDLSEMEGAQSAYTIDIPYGTGFRTQFAYDEENKIYNRIENGVPNTDHATGEQFNTKNIIVQKITYKPCSDGYYWDLATIGSGTGYFITNGYAVPIKWSKSSRAGKTKYTYLDGTEIEVSDGRTYIELQTTKQTLTITPKPSNESVATKEAATTK